MILFLARSARCARVTETRTLWMHLKKQQNYQQWLFFSLPRYEVNFGPENGRMTGKKVEREQIREIKLEKSTNVSQCLLPGYVVCLCIWVYILHIMSDRCEVACSSCFCWWFFHFFALGALSFVFFSELATFQSSAVCLLYTAHFIGSFHPFC